LAERLAKLAADREWVSSMAQQFAFTPGAFDDALLEA
jgi:hypothetical protein